MQCCRSSNSSRGHFEKGASKDSHTRSRQSETLGRSILLRVNSEGVSWQREREAVASFHPDSQHSTTYTPPQVNKVAFPAERVAEWRRKGQQSWSRSLPFRRSLVFHSLVGSRNHKGQTVETTHLT